MKDRIRIIEKDLDLNNNFFINCVCKQYDTIKFIFHIFMDGEVADLTDCIFRLQAKKGDGLPYVNNKSENISVNGNIVTIDNDNQLTARAGDTVAEVVITDNEGHMKTTFDIRLNIIGSAIDGLVNSEATITILDTLEEKLNRIDNIGTVLDEASIVKNELENNTSIANKASESLNSLIPTGTTLKNTLEPLITNGTTLKTDLDTANTLAEHNIEELNKLGDVTDLAEKVETNTNLIAELNQNDTDIKATIGTETIGTTATTLKGAIKEVKGIADNNTTQLNDNTKITNPVDDVGTVNTYIITLANAPTTYVKYQTFRFIAKTSNTGASTLNVNGLGAKALIKDVNTPLVAGDILAGQIVTAIYDGTNFQIIPNFKAQLANKADITTTDLTITLLTGWTSVGSAYTYCRKNNKVVQVSMLVTNTSATNVNDYIGKVDTTVKPQYIVSISIVNRTTGAINSGYINQEGYIYPIASGLSANTQYSISVSYIL